jgi:tRNA A-37 threonylcarbamoyl transferase component Bud32
MNAVEYRRICRQKNAFRVSELEETLSVLRQEDVAEASVVATALLSGMVETPQLHTCQRSERFCLVLCSLEQADVIVDALFDVEASSIPAIGEATAETERLVHLVNKWLMYRETP